MKCTKTADFKLEMSLPLGRVKTKTFLPPTRTSMKNERLVTVVSRMHSFNTVNYG